MPTLAFSDPALRQQLGLRSDCTDIVSVQTSFRRVRRQYRSRAELKSDVLNVLRSAERPLSRREIANRVGISKNWQLLDVLAEAVCQCQIIEHESAYRNFIMFVYEVA